MQGVAACCNTTTETPRSIAVLPTYPIGPSLCAHYEIADCSGCFRGAIASHVGRISASIRCIQPSCQ